MKYKGMIKGSRTLDLAALSVVIDAMSLGFLAYSPEQLGITIAVYMAIRIALTSLQAYLRFKTTGPVGEK
ncbi:MAG: hypothetical protein ACYC1K_03300 [Minisyncoccota bacterium]